MKTIDFIAILALILLFSGCGNSNKQVGQKEGEVVADTVVTLEEVEKATDEKLPEVDIPKTKKLVSAKFYDTYYDKFRWLKTIENIKYDGNKVVSYDVKEDDGYSYSNTFSYLDDKIVTSDDTYSCSEGLIQNGYRNGPEYDGNKMKKYKIRQEVSYFFTWENDNVVFGECPFDKDEEAFTYKNDECKSPLTYMWLYHTPYDASSNLSDPEGMFLMAEGYYGTPFTHNLIDRCVYDMGWFEFKYEKDEDGYVTKCTVYASSYGNKPFQKLELTWAD